MKFTYHYTYCFLIFILLGCSNTALTKDVDKMFRPFDLCPDSPNCVNSLPGQKMASKKHYIEPLDISSYNAKNQDLMNRMKRELLSNPSYTLVKEEGLYLHFVFKSSLFGFLDDVEIQLDPESKVFNFKSSSRKGYYDFGANKKRVEEIKFKFSQSSF